MELALKLIETAIEQHGAAIEALRLEAATLRGRTIGTVPNNLFTPNTAVAFADKQAKKSAAHPRKAATKRTGLEADRPLRKRQAGVGKSVMNMIAACTGDGFSLNEIVVNTGAKQPSVVAALKSLEARGKIAKNSYGLYMLASAGHGGVSDSGNGVSEYDAA